MKIDRRNFLALGFGAVAGTVLSPMPWKMTDDSAIWTQNWPWTPVPEDGEATYSSTVCTLCPGNCGISVRKINDRAVKIEGQDGYPVNDGGICALGLSGLQLLYGPARIETPIKKVNGQWKKITWDDAVSLVCEKLNLLRNQNNAKSLACISGSNSGVINALFERFLKVYGSPNMISVPSIQDSYKLVASVMNGVKADVGFDLENTDCLLSFGSGIIDGWGSPVRMLQANSILKNKKAKVVQFDSRLSHTAAIADSWVPVKPDSYADLAYGIANVIIRESLYNSDFINNYSDSFKVWEKIVLEKYSPEQVAIKTGLDKGKIVEVARKFAKADKPLAICGYGQGKISGSMSEFFAVHALNALVGNINKEGGVWTIPEIDYADWSEVVMDKVASNNYKSERIDGAGTKYLLGNNNLLNNLTNVINDSKNSPVQALFVTEANPIYSMADTEAVKKAFEKIPFIVSFSSYMDETAEMSDLILPNPTYLERFEDVPSAPGISKRVVGLTKPVVEPIGKTINSGDSLILIAKALSGNIGDAFPWEDYYTCLEETLSDKWSDLDENGFWMDAEFVPAQWNKAFGTASGKFEFISKNISVQDQFYSTQFEGDTASFPLMLIPADSMRVASGNIADPPFVMKTISDEVLKGNDIFVEINPLTAKKFGLSDGGNAVITTSVGEANVRVFFFDGIMLDVIAMPTGLGHTSQDMYISGKGVNFNKIIRSVPDPISGLDSAVGIMANIAKA